MLLSDEEKRKKMLRSGPNMENIKKSAAQLIGNTPLMELCNYEKKYELQARVIAKLEYFNPAGSAKDRVALSMIEEAEREGKLKPGATIIEPTSGNTGIGIASVAARQGLPRDSHHAGDHECGAPEAA